MSHLQNDNINIRWNLYSNNVVIMLKSAFSASVKPSQHILNAYLWEVTSVAAIKPPIKPHSDFFFFVHSPLTNCCEQAAFTRMQRLFHLLRQHLRDNQKRMWCHPCSAVSAFFASQRHPLNVELTSRKL